MKQFSILAFSGLLGLAAAVPFAKRDLVTVVVTQEVVETIDITTTVWVPAGGAAATPTSVFVNNAYSKSFPAVSSTSSSQSLPAAAAISKVRSSEPPVHSPVPQPPSSSSSGTSSTANPSAPVYTPPVYTSSTTSQVQTPATPASPAATSCLPYPNPATTAGVLPGAYSPASCNSASQTCSGDITYYDVGMGACGIVSAANESVIALSYLMMGTGSNSNPLCGKTVTIHNANTGASAQATVVDKCMGCVSLTRTSVVKSGN